jgi:hypothetical protein
VSELLPHPSHLAAFIRAVAVLALPATDQVEWLGTLAPGSPVGCDELALEFDDGWRLLPQFISNGWLNEAVGEAAQQIDQLLSEMSKSANAMFLIPLR